MLGQVYFLCSVGYFGYGYGFDEFTVLLPKDSYVFILFRLIFLNLFVSTREN